MALYNICMGISSSNKELSVSRIGCGDTFQIKLSLTAEPDIKTNPTDIVLVLDRSGSMAGSPLANLKNGAKNIIKPGATEMVIREELNSCFGIVSIAMPTAGKAHIIDSTTLQWEIEKLGVDKSEGAELTFTVRHTGSCSGNVEVNEEITYSDAENNVVTFPSPKIEVDCNTVVMPEQCPKPTAITIDGCEDTVEFDAGEIGMESLGRILQLDVTVKNVCPNKRVALAVILTEVDEHGTEYKRGMKTMTIPAHTGSGCHDVTVRCIKFVLPEDLDVSGSTDSMCNRRNFKARMIAHYIDDGFA